MYHTLTEYLVITFSLTHYTIWTIQANSNTYNGQTWHLAGMLARMARGSLPPLATITLCYGPPEMYKHGSFVRWFIPITNSYH